jgi:TetR/AcrR family transcriptional repressor of nem operon
VYLATKTVPIDRALLTQKYDRNTMPVMRYPRGHKQQTNERILRAAGRLFREQGYAATGVDAVMTSAQLTAGAFYSHFQSKEGLLAETLDAVFRWASSDRPLELSQLQGHAWLRAFTSFYLSRDHRNAADCGCPIPALAAEVARLGGRTRKVFEHHLRRIIEFIAQQFDEQHPDRQRAIATTALLAGAVLLARAVGDEVFSEEILRACREAAINGIEQSSGNSSSVEFREPADQSA